jgi:hypothetical protein
MRVSHPRRSDLSREKNEPFKGPVHMGSQVPSPTHVSKSQYGENVPTFELQTSIKHGKVSLKSDIDYFVQKNVVGLMLTLNFCSTQLSTQVPCLTSKSVAWDIPSLKSLNPHGREISCIHQLETPKVCLSGASNFPKGTINLIIIIINTFIFFLQLSIAKHVRQKRLCRQQAFCSLQRVTGIKVSQYASNHKLTPVRQLNEVAS